MAHILVVDDDLDLQDSLVALLEQAGHSASTAAGGREALDLVASEEFAIVLLDGVMPAMDGLETLSRLRIVRPRQRVVMLTGFASVRDAVKAVKMGASDYLTKPIRPGELLMTIRRVLEEAKFEESLQALDLEETLSSLANSIRRRLIHLLYSRPGLRLKELTREMDLADHTKVIFHLKILKDNRIIVQGQDKSYRLTEEGQKAAECLRLIRQYL